MRTALLALFAVCLLAGGCQALTLLECIDLKILINVLAKLCNGQRYEYCLRNVVKCLSVFPILNGNLNLDVLDILKNLLPDCAEELGLEINVDVLAELTVDTTCPLLLDILARVIVGVDINLALPKLLICIEDKLGNLDLFEVCVKYGFPYNIYLPP